MRSVLALFDKPKLRVDLHAASRAEHGPASGLIPVEYRASVEPRRPLALRAFIGGAPVLEVAAPDGAAAGQFVLHSHLLPNGPAALKVQVRAGSKVLAERSLTLQIRNEGEIAEAVRGSLRRNGAPVAFEGPCDSGRYDYADVSMTAWFDREPDAVEAHLAAVAADGAASAEEMDALRHFALDGYLTLPDVVAPEHLGRLNAALDDAVERKLEGYEWGSSQRMHNLHAEYPAVRELWTHPKILRMLQLIFGVPANPCQSLTYIFGSEQQYHQDLIHLTPFPAGRMCGVWTALEDVQPDSGELVVFPKSHRFGRIYMRTAGVAKVQGNWDEFAEKVVPIWSDIIHGNGLERVVYQPKAGTVLIWHENLMHAGQPRKDRSISRRSIVGHYFAKGALVYYDSSGQPGFVDETVTA